MSRNYDNWERLVAAVLKREEIWEICHAPSRNTSFNSIASSSDFSLSSDENSKSAKSTDQESAIQIEKEWFERYESGVYITIADLSDGTREIKRLQFSASKFKFEEAESWWRENKKKVCEKYNAQVKQSLISSQAASGESEGNKLFNKPNELIPVALLGATLDNKLKSANSEWTEQYEAGVYITIGVSRDGRREIRRVRLSRRKFREIEAETWWLDNREKVYQKYNAQLKQLSSVSGQPKSASKEINENPSDSQIVNEWVEMYEPGVHVTIRDYRDGIRNVTRVKFSEKFEVHQGLARIRL